MYYCSFIDLVSRLGKNMKSLQEIVNDLILHGFTEEQIAKAVGATQPTINRIKTGVTANPGSDIGRRLDELYSKNVGTNAA